VVLPTQTARTRVAILGTLAAVICMLAFAASAFADDPAPTAATGATGSTGATGTVGSLGADPTVRVASRKHCVSSKVVLTPQYTGGGGIAASFLYLNGQAAAARRSPGALTISFKRLARGVNSYELVSIFTDGRSASAVGTIRRCGGH
jgi:hypothetical protein